MSDRLFSLKQQIERCKQKAQAGFSEATSYEKDDNLQDNRLLALQQSLNSSQFGYGLEFGLVSGEEEDDRLLALQQSLEETSAPEFKQIGYADAYSFSSRGRKRFEADDNRGSDIEDDGDFGINDEMIDQLGDRLTSKFEEVDEHIKEWSDRLTSKFEEVGERMKERSRSSR